MCDTAHSSHVTSAHVDRCYLTSMNMQQVECNRFADSLIDTVSVLHGTTPFVRQNTTCFMWREAICNLQLTKHKTN
jgi:hypothetical protein